MKKLLFGLAGILLAGNVWASDFKVGDEMPIQDKKYFVFDEKIDLSGSRKIVREFYNVDNEGKNDFVEAYLVCGNKMSKTPYGVFDFNTRTLYLDNKPYDGVIDQVIQIPDGSSRSISRDAPYCSKTV